ncbi:hypothetical protein IHQ71_11780 [Rhizobium sp. TH2]|uniref:hypothetical protein n=1 Tax=Rhizobium sp. TH2 TaxID=2775403 RepID=UPI0021573E73|nr:hypothetical protein [Rhizobium sp. TH2]UVC11187.1 hypothetical protein IHQ71_11780 [Rhizobium sp. TH2]
MAFELRKNEGTTPLRIRAMWGTVEDLESAVRRYENELGFASHVGVLRDIIHNRTHGVAIKLQLETRIIAYAALALAAIQTYFTIWPRI